jgi:hypothetical protein
MVQSTMVNCAPVDLYISSVCWTKLPYEWTDGQTSPTHDSSHEWRAPPWVPFFCVNEDTQDSKTDPQDEDRSPRRYPRRSPRTRLTLTRPTTYFDSLLGLTRQTSWSHYSLLTSNNNICFASTIILSSA